MRAVPRGLLGPNQRGAFGARLQLSSGMGTPRRRAEGQAIDCARMPRPFVQPPCASQRFYRGFASISGFSAHVLDGEHGDAPRTWRGSACPWQIRMNASRILKVSGWAYTLSMAFTRAEPG